MTTTARLITLSLALGLAAGCTATPATTPTTPTATKRPAVKPAATATLSGQVMAPPGIQGANLVAAGGGNLVAAGGGNIVAAGGGNLVAAGGGNYRLSASEEAPLANAWVQLVTKDGKAVAGLQPVQADATGHFTFKGVSPDVTYVVQSVFENASKQQGKLRSLARAGGTAQLNAASTCVAVSLLADLQADMGAMDPAKFDAAVKLTRESLSAEKWPDLTDTAAITAKMSSMRAAIPALGGAMDAMAETMKQVQAQVDKATAEAQKAADDAKDAIKGMFGG